MEDRKLKTGFSLVQLLYHDSTLLLSFGEDTTLEHLWGIPILEGYAITLRSVWVRALRIKEPRSLLFFPYTVRFGMF